MMDNIIINEIYNITIENCINGMKCAIKIDSLTHPTLSLIEYIKEYNAYNRIFDKKNADWREMFADGTRFLIDGEFKDLDKQEFFYGTYDLIANTFVPKDEQGE
jgi:hypothetical protein